MIGGQIRAGAAALKYDAAAITWGYTGADFRTLDFGGGFCTDEHLDAASDCSIFTQSGNVIAANANYVLKTSERVARNLLGQLIGAKVPPDLTDAVTFDELPLEPLVDASYDVNDLAFVMNALRDLEASAGTFFRVHDTFKVVTSLHRESEEAAILAFQKAGVKAAGGIDAILSPLRPTAQDDGTVMPAFLADLNEQFAALLARPEVLKNTTARGQTYELSADDVTAMKAIAKTYFKEYAEVYVANAMSVISGSEFGGGAFAHFDLAGLSAELKALADAVILAEGAEVTGTVAGDEVTVKAPYYKSETMEAAASLYSSSLADVSPDTFNDGVNADASAALAAKLAIIDKNGAATTDDMPAKLKQIYYDLTTVKDTVDGI
jgi:hypothetical protein